MIASLPPREAGWTPESAEWLGRVFGSGSDYFASSAEYHPLRQILGSRAGAEPSAAVVAEGTLLALGEAMVWVWLFLACFRDGREKQRRANELTPTAGAYREPYRALHGRSLPPYLPPSHLPPSRLLEPLGLLGDAAGYAYLEPATDVEGGGEGWPGDEGLPQNSFPRAGSRASFYDDGLDVEAPSERSLSAPLQRELLEARRDAFEQDQRSALVREQQREVIALQKQLALLGCTPPAASAASAVAANSPASAPEGYNTSPPGAGEGVGEGASSHHRPSASTPFLV